MKCHNLCPNLLRHIKQWKYQIAKKIFIESLNLIFKLVKLWNRLKKKPSHFSIRTHFIRERDICGLLYFQGMFLKLQATFTFRLKTKFTDTKRYKKQPSKGVLRKRCFGNTKQIYRGKPMAKYDIQ